MKNALLHPLFWLPVLLFTVHAVAQPIAGDLPAKPVEKPLDWRALADALDACLMDTANHAMLTRPDGEIYFPSALEGESDELITYGPIVIGKWLRGEDVSGLLPTLAGYFNEDAGLFMNGTRGHSIEYWYLLNVDALAAGIIRTALSDDDASVEKFRRTADRLIEMTRQIDYDFNDQGYDFETNKPWTRRDIYRQPDALGAYAYLMLMAYEMFGERSYLDEARTGLTRYQAFVANPWYEIPSGAMASLAAARLEAHHGVPGIDLPKVVAFALDPEGGPLQLGEWGGREVNGLMRGWRFGDRYAAYSMESMVALPYLLPVLRYDTRFAAELGKVVLHVAANMRWFYSEYLPAEQQGRPELHPAIPYEKLSREENGQSPFAGGDFAGLRSIYGGAYALWLGEMLRPTSDDFILQIDISMTDFLAGASYPTYLYYNPWPEERSISLQLGDGAFDLYETTSNQWLAEGAGGAASLQIPGGGAQVVVVVPSGGERASEDGVLTVDGVVVAYGVE